MYKRQGADFPVDLLGVSDTGFQFRRAFVLQVLSGFLSSLQVFHRIGALFACLLQLSGQAVHTLLQILYMLRQLCLLYTSRCV